MEHDVDSNVAPLINDYKRSFFLKRWVQTILGGMKLKIDSPNVHWSIRLCQLLLFFLPLTIGFIMTIVVKEAGLAVYLGSLIAAVIVLLVMISAQLISKHYRSKDVMFDIELAGPNMEDEDQFDLDDFDSPDTFRFILPAHGNLLVTSSHLLLGGLISAASVHLFDIASLQSLLSDNTAGIVIYLLLAWFACGVSLYPVFVQAPYELAQYRFDDTNSLTPYNRAFYFLLPEVFNLIYVSSDIAKNNSVFRDVHYGIMLCLPFLSVLYAFGWCAPLDALFSWLGEQIHIVVLGGSAMRSNTCLIGYVCGSFSIIVFSFILYQYALSNTSLISCSIGFGLLFSLDFGSNLSDQHPRRLSVPSSQLSVKSYFSGKIHDRQFVVIFSLGIIVSIIGIVIDAAGIDNITSRIDSSLRDSLLFDIVVIGIWGFKLVLLEPMLTPQPYTFFNMIRNPFYSSTVYSHGNNYRGLLFQSLLWVIRCILLVYGLTHVGPPAVGSSFYLFWRAILVFRLFRKIWQMPNCSLAEFTFAIICNRAISDNVLPSVYVNGGFETQCVIIGFVVMRLLDFSDKLLYITTHLITCFKYPKLRVRNTRCLVFITILASPFYILVLAISCLLSCPLISVLGAPVFLLGFPRPLRLFLLCLFAFMTHIPESGASSCVAAMYYQQMWPELLSQISRQLRAGMFGNAVPGSFFLLRYESFLIWMQIIEDGFGYTVITLKGLELQATSCHALEASQVDTILSSSLSDQRGCLNEFGLQTMTPLGVFNSKSYSITNNTVVGILDSPDNIQLISQTFLRTLVWVLHQDLCLQDIPTEWRRRIVNSADLGMYSSKFPYNFYKFLNHQQFIGADSTEIKSSNSSYCEQDFQTLVLNCYLVVEVLGLAGRTVDLAHVNRVFHGQLPVSIKSDWLKSNPELLNLVVKAYRYAVKAVYDCFCLVELDALETTTQEQNTTFQQLMIDYDLSWHIGPVDEEWNQKVSYGVEMLWALQPSLESGKYLSRSLRLDSQPIQVAKLSSAVITSIWASLSLELLYFANDDDERYSIQAHPVLLRNITVQASEAPLGYPIAYLGPTTIKS